MRLTTKEYKALRRLCREAERAVRGLRVLHGRNDSTDDLVYALNEVVPLLEVERLRIIEKQRKKIPPEQDNPRRLV